MTPSPIKPITVKLGGVEYELKFGPSAEYVADALGVNVQDFAAGIATRKVGTFAVFVKLFSAMVAHHFVRQNQVVPSPEHWALVVEGEADPYKKIAEIGEAVMQVLLAKYRASAPAKLREPAPIQEQTLN